MRVLVLAQKMVNPFMTKNVEMYSEVPPPPDQLCSEATTAAPSPDTAQQDAVDYTKPEHISSQQWKVSSDSTHTLQVLLNHTGILLGHSN